MSPTWLTAFLDLAAEEFEPAVAFWEQVTGYGRSAPRGENEEFATLVPPAGDAFLRVQRIGGGRSGVHVDVHAPAHDFDVRRPPGGLAHCLVSGSEAVRPEPAIWPDGNRSMVDQVCIDTPPGQPLAVLLQRLDAGDGPVRAHLDLSADDRDAEVRRHESLGARVAAVHDGWTMMTPPAGPVYCITRRVPRA